MDRLAGLDHPLALEPLAQSRVWGGRRIAEMFGRELPEGAIGESWEIHGQLPVTCGALAGCTLDSLVSRYGERLLGRRGQASETFPLLTKWLDCKDWLSVQVHPDDNLARELTGQPNARGKSEAWYVVAAEAGASLIHDWKSTPPQSVEQLSSRDVLDLVQQLSPPPGSLLFTGAGTVHALGPGFLIYEVQQSSDLTYRLYDWERDRPVHPEASWRCVQEAQSIEARQDERGLSCRYFEIEILDGDTTLRLDGESFAIVAAVQGGWRLEGEFATVELVLGASALLPAYLGSVRASGSGRLLRIGLGDATL